MRNKESRNEICSMGSDGVNGVPNWFRGRKDFIKTCTGSEAERRRRLPGVPAVYFAYPLMGAAIVALTGFIQ